MKLTEKIANSKVIIVLGTGGVGKTTVSASLALALAHSGKRALVSTIDPAKRLVTALSLDKLSGEPQELKLDLKDNSKGQFFAMMLDMKSSWDKLIESSIDDLEKRNLVLNNKFYNFLSTKLAGSLEYMALSNLHDLYKSGDYDVIVIDTPPLANALDFLHAPQKIIDLFEHKAMQWLIGPSKKGFSGNSKKAMFEFGGNFLAKNIAKFTGGDFLSQLGSLISNMMNALENFKSRSAEIDKVLKSDQCSYLLVAGPREQNLKAAEAFLQELRYEGIRIHSFIFNRMSDQLKELDQKVLEKVLCEENNELSTKELEELVSLYNDYLSNAELERKNIKAMIERNDYSAEQIHYLKTMERTMLNRSNLHKMIENTENETK